MTKKRISVEIDVLRELNKLCTEYNVTLDSLFKRLVTYRSLIEEFLSFPDDVTVEMVVDTTTVVKQVPYWLDNVRAKFKMIKEGKNLMDMQMQDDMPMLVIGAGPTLYRNKHLELLAEKGFDGHIFATDAVLKDCLELGIIPDYVMFTDASIKIKRFIDHDIVNKYADKLTALMNIYMHPEVVNRWKGDIMWYQTFIDEIFAPNVSRVVQRILHMPAITSGGHCASIGWGIGVFKGYNPMVLIGVDLSYPEGMPIEGTRLFEQYLEGGGGDKEKTLEQLKRSYKHYHHKFFNTDCYFEAIFETYTESARRHMKQASEKGIKIINCTEGGTVEGEGIECMWFNDFLESQNRKIKK